MTVTSAATSTEATAAAGTAETWPPWATPASRAAQGVALSNRRRRRDVVRRSIGVRVRGDRTCDICNDTDHVAQRVRDSASGNLFGRSPAVESDPTHFVCTDEGTAADLLRSTHDGVLLAVPVRTIRSVADNVADTL